MKNKKSPVKIVGQIAQAAGQIGSNIGTGTFGGAVGAATGNLLTGQGTRIQNPKDWVTQARGPIPGAGGGSVEGYGARPQQVVDAATQFDDGTVTAAEGIFGNVNARQASLGGSGMMALKKHLSPVNNGEELSAEEAARMHATQSVTDKAIHGQDYEGQHGTVITTSKSLNAYKSPNPPYDPNSGDDGAGGKTYETN
tara:strand:- start:72 stop:662 length:591 start_codon:yes stop_codon:yes gene_type:complete